MELGRTKNWFYALLAAAVGFIFILGAWWLYLVFKFATALEGANKTALPSNLVLMVKWEGLSFFVLTLAVGAAVIYIFWQDHKKTKSLQTFYATLTHELKTPLASMRLQSQVLGELIGSLPIDQDERQKIERYGNRLQEDVVRLEGELDKHLQLSRVEGGGNLNLTQVSLASLINAQKKNFPELSVNILGPTEIPAVKGDQTALSIIFKNLFENTLRHSKNEKKNVDISVVEKDGRLVLTYDDHGRRFQGNPKDLGKLFFKHDSPKGSGIGLYLIKRLTTGQGGKFAVKNDPRLVFELTFDKGDELE